MIDVLIRNATVVDGTGAPATTGDVAIENGRVSQVGEVTGEAAEEIDATGKVLTPGFIDPHTHYDAQLLWDSYASPSNLHGITTIISGNCGFTLAPLKAEDAGWTLEMMAEVEGMPLPALQAGVPGDWSSFAEYLDKLEGNLGVNAAFLVGHCQLRRYVMGAEHGDGPASEEQIQEMANLLHEALTAGGFGFSSTQSFSHNDGDGKPVPSRNATTEELLALCEMVSNFEGTTLEYITDGCLNGFSEEEIERLAKMSLIGQRPVNWNVLTVDSRTPELVDRQLEASRYAAALGGKVVALTMPILVPMNISFKTRCALTLIPGWDEILTKPLDERKKLLKDPQVRAKMQEDAQAEAAGVLRRMNRWEDYTIGDTFSEENKPLEDRRVGDIAEERGQSAFDTLVDIVLADDLQTVIWPRPLEDDEESWKMRMDLLASGQAMVGGSDGGAHLDRMLGSVYPTRFLADVLRGRKLVRLEQAVQMMSETPAQLFGLRDRGTIAQGNHADLVLFDPETIDAGPVRTVKDLPSGAARLFSESLGVERVFVNGTTIVKDGQPTGETPGTLLRSGRDSQTVLMG